MTRTWREYAGVFAHDPTPETCAEMHADCAAACFDCALACGQSERAQGDNESGPVVTDYHSRGLDCADICNKTGRMLMLEMRTDPFLVAAQVSACRQACLDLAQAHDGYSFDKARHGGWRAACHACAAACQALLSVLPQHRT